MWACSTCGISLRTQSSVLVYHPNSDNRNQLSLSVQRRGLLARSENRFQSTWAQLIKEPIRNRFEKFPRGELLKTHVMIHVHRGHGAYMVTQGILWGCYRGASPSLRTEAWDKLYTSYTEISQKQVLSRFLRQRGTRIYESTHLSVLCVRLFLHSSADLDMNKQSRIVTSGQQEPVKDENLSCFKQSSFYGTSRSLGLTVPKPVKVHLTSDTPINFLER